MTQRLIRSLAVLVLTLMVGQVHSKAQSTGALGTGPSPTFRGIHSPLLPAHKSPKAAGATSRSQPGAVELELAKLKVYNFTTADYPGADSSVAYDFNSGIVVGSFDTPAAKMVLSFTRTPTTHSALALFTPGSTG